MRTEFSTLDIVKSLEIPRERLRDWMNRDFVTPSTVANGQGTRAIFTLPDVYSVALFRSLINYGFSRAVAGDFVHQFMKIVNAGPDSKEVAYILIRESVNSVGTTRRSITAIAPGECKVDLITGTTDEMQAVAKMAKHKNLALADKVWRLIHIVNFETLRKEVDATLAEL